MAIKNQLPWLVAGGIVYWATALLGMHILALQPSNITLFWLPSGVGLVMAVRAGWLAWPFIFMASFAANAPGMMALEGGDRLYFTLVAAAVDSLLPFLSRFLLRLKLDEASLHNVNELVLFALLACVLPSMLAALLLSGNLYWGGYIQAQDTGAMFLQLTAADSLGILLVFPLYQVWRLGLISRALFSWNSFYFALLSLALVALTFFVVPGIIYLLPPVLAYIAYQKNTQLLMPLILLVIASIFYCAHFYLGPFALPLRNAGLTSLVMFSFLLTLAPMAILLHSRELKAAVEARDTWMGFAQVDQLSGLPNRYGFGPQLKQAYEQAHRYKRPLVVAMADLDHFKKVNDTYGHLVGDKVIRELANLIRQTIRKTDLPCRYGGEEFALVFPETRLEQAIPVLERLRESCAQHVIHLGPGTQFSVTISLGAVEYLGEDLPVEQLFKSADELLYRAKAQGRNQLVVDRH